MEKMAKFILVFAIVLGFIASGCNNDDEEEDINNNTNNNPSMTANWNGNPWTAEEPSASIMNEKINITGIDSDGRTISITLNDNGEGTYNLAYNGENAAAVTPDQGGVNPAWTSNSHADAGGSVIITEINTSDSTITGTFSFDAYRYTDNSFVEITNGKFINVKWTSTMPSTPDNNFAVTINGTIWTPTSISASVAMGKLMINATNSEATKTVGLSMPQSITAGTYSFSPFGDYLGQYNIGSSTFLQSQSGTLIITSHVPGTSISGTFEFEALQMGGSTSASLTNGSFEINY
jgi:hypothetical protein